MQHGKSSGVVVATRGIEYECDFTSTETGEEVPHQTGVQMKTEGDDDRVDVVGVGNTEVWELDKIRNVKEVRTSMEEKVSGKTRVA